MNRLRRTAEIIPKIYRRRARGIPLYSPRDELNGGYLRKLGLGRFSAGVYAGEIYSAPRLTSVHDARAECVESCGGARGWTWYSLSYESNTRNKMVSLEHRN